jgi:hypothetical protein
LTPAEIAATAPAAAIATTATTVAATTTTTVAAAVGAMFATETTAVAAVFAAGLFATGGRHEDGLGRDAEQGGELALQRRPEADRRLDGDDDGFNLDARALFATRTVFATRAIAFGAWFARFATRTGGTFRARFTRFATRAVAGDAGLAAFFGSGAFGSVFTTRAVFATRAIAFGARFATFARRLAWGRLLGEFAREVLGDFGRIGDHADRRAGVLALAARGDILRDATTTELLRGDDGAWLGGGFAGSADHGKGRKFRVGGFQLGFGDARRRGGGGRVLFRRRGGGVGGRVVLPGVFLAHGFSWCGDRMFGRLVKAVSAVVAERPGLRSIPVASKEGGEGRLVAETGVSEPL